MEIFLPVLLILLGAILVKYLLPLVFNLCGWRTGLTLTFEERTGAILLLFCTAVMAGVAYWYPWYLCTYYSAPDDRYGFALLPAFPFWLIGPAFAARALFTLLKAVRQRSFNTANGFFVAGGISLAMMGFSPLAMSVLRMLTR